MAGRIIIQTMLAKIVLIIDKIKRIRRALAKVPKIPVDSEKVIPADSEKVTLATTLRINRINTQTTVAQTSRRRLARVTGRKAIKPRPQAKKVKEARSGADPLRHPVHY